MRVKSHLPFGDGGLGGGQFLPYFCHSAAQCCVPFSGFDSYFFLLPWNTGSFRCITLSILSTLLPNSSRLPLIGVFARSCPLIDESAPPVLFCPSVHPPLRSLSLSDCCCFSVCLIPFFGFGNSDQTPCPLERLLPQVLCPTFTAVSPRCSLAVPSLHVPQSCSPALAARSWAITLPPKHLFTAVLLSICSPGAQSILPNATKINTGFDNPIHFSILLFLPVHPSLTCTHPSAQV